jgi:hypothetical protein
MNKYKYIRNIKITKYSKSANQIYLKNCDINEERTVTRLRHINYLSA